MTKVKKINIDDVSAANLPEEFQITNPRHYIKEMRSTFFKKIRLKKGLTQENVAKECDIDIEELKSIESGAVNPNLMMTLHSLSEFYEIDYLKVLNLYNLLERKPEENNLGLAAYHSKQIDEKTQAELEAFVNNFKE